MKYPEQANPQWQREKSWFPQNRGKENYRVTANGLGVSFGDDKNVLKLVSSDQKSVNTLKPPNCML